MNALSTRQAVEAAIEASKGDRGQPWSPWSLVKPQHVATCETNGHLWGSDHKCIMCGEWPERHIATEEEYAAWLAKQPKPEQPQREYWWDKDIGAMFYGPEFGRIQLVPKAELDAALNAEANFRALLDAQRQITRNVQPQLRTPSDEALARIWVNAGGYVGSHPDGRRAIADAIIKAAQEGK